MAELSLVQYLAKGEVTPFEAGVLETIITTDELAGFLPWASTTQDVIKYLREKALPSFGWLAAAATLTPDASAQNAEVLSYLRTVGGDMQFNNLQSQAGGGTRSVAAKAIAAASKALARLIGTAIINGASGFTATLDTTATTLAATITTITPGPNHDLRNPYASVRYTHVGTLFSYKAPGDSAYGAGVICALNATTRVYSDNPDLYIDVTRNGVAIGADATGAIVLSGGTAQIDGLISLAQSSQQIATATNGENLSFPLIDKLIQGNRDTGSQKVLVFAERTFISWMALMRTMGGVTMMELQGRQVPRYNNCPVLQTGWMPTTQTKGTSSTCTSAFCITLGSENGLSGVYNNNAPNDLPPPNARLLGQSAPGIQIWDLGLAGTADARKLRATAYVGLMNKLVPGISWANGILD